MNVHLATTRYGQRGSAPATMIMLIALSVVGCLTLTGVAHAFLTFNRMQNLTDQAALEAADAASGRIAGYPCQLAKTLAEDSGIALSGCSVEGLVSRVTFSATIYGFQVKTRAKAGPKNLFHS